MSSDFDELVRRGRDVLPEPDAAATSRARAAALASALRPRRRRARAAVLAAALLVAAGTGAGLGALLTPSGTAASSPPGLGFLPAPGWSVLQDGRDATLAEPRIALAANVTMADDEAGGLPYRTLLALPRDGAVLMVTFSVRDPRQPNDRYPVRKLPLRLRDARPFIEFGTQIRPERPLGQYQLLASVDDRNIDLTVYFGTPQPGAALLQAVQRQLDRLVVGPGASERVAERALGGRVMTAAGVAASAAPSRVVDRTLECATSMTGGARDIEVSGHRGTGAGGAGWARPAVVMLTSGPSALGGPTNATALDNALAWAAAGRPAATATLLEYGHPDNTRLYRLRVFGTLALSGRVCRPSQRAVALGTAGLTGGALGKFEEGYTCAAPRRVLVRLRARLERPASLTGYRSFRRTPVTVKEAQLAVQTFTGTRIAVATVSESGEATLFAARGCYPT